VLEEKRSGGFLICKSKFWQQVRDRDRPIHVAQINQRSNQTRLANRDGPPIIFVTGQGDILTPVKAMKGGATEKSYTRLLRVLVERTR
jgi:hypothetical protein